ncbi:MAG: hypothetical protein ABIW03_03100 [Sphingomicrobium sp.]
MEQVLSRPMSSIAATVESQFVAAVERSALQPQPFDHIYMADVLDPETYRALLAKMPDRRFYHELRHRDALRADGTSTRLRLYLYPELLWRFPAEQRRVWLPVARALCSQGLENAFKRKFGAALENRFGKPVERIGVYPIPILLRDSHGYRIGIHSDVPTKAITVQYYLPSDASQRHIGTIFHEGDTGDLAERTTRMPFMPASGYAFPVTAKKSWHSAAQTTEGDGERISMMVTYYVADSLKSWSKYRLRRILNSFGRHPER